MNSKIREYILAPIFGERNFRNEIVWSYKGGASTKNHFPNKHDTLFWYSKTDVYVSNIDLIREPYAESTKKDFNKEDEKGKYRLHFFYQDVEKKYYKTYMSEGKIPTDVWQIDAVVSNSHERINYPTQKPEALLERIIKASSNEGDIVLDPFVGGGTTVAVANRLGRQWIGIDQSAQAVRVSENRINNQGLDIPFEAKQAVRVENSK
jgi:DNA modification methylase